MFTRRESSKMYKKCLVQFLFLALLFLTGGDAFSRTGAGVPDANVIRGGDSRPASCRGVTPLYVVAGERVDLEISGKNTGFDSTTAVSFACDTLVQNGLISVDAAEKIRMNVTVMDMVVDADPCVVTVTTGDEVIVCEDFAVLAEPPCLLISAYPTVLLSGWLLPRLYFVTVWGDGNCFFDVTNASVVSGYSYLLPILSVPFGNRVVVPVIVWPGAEQGHPAVLDVAGADNFVDITILEDVLP